TSTSSTGTTDTTATTSAAGDTSTTPSSSTNEALDSLGLGKFDSALLQTAKRAVHVSDGGLTSFITDQRQFLVLLTALALRSQLNILATPHVIAADNREAHILIGEEVPILTSTQQSFVGTSSDRLLSSIQYRDTGKILT